MSKVIFVRFQAFVATGIISVFAVLGLPALSQETEGEGESILIESTITADVDPSAAVTVEDLTIPLDQLELLVKPLTLEELQIEAAAWLLLLKDKVQEISQTEIAIKRGQQAIQDKEGAAKAVEEAEAKLAQAEAAKADAEPGTPQDEQATKQLEEAKQALQEAQQAVEKSVETQEELQEDEELQEALEEGKSEKQIAAARQALTEARKEQEQLTVGSAAYDAATKKIDALDQALIDLEGAEEALAGAVPDSPEYQELSKKVDQTRSAVIQATEALSEEGLTPSQGEDEAEVESDEVLVETDLRDQLLVNVTELQAERTAITDRLNVVLDALDKKGGDTTSYRKYIEAVSGIELDVTDTEGLGVRLVSWLKSEEGGIRLGLNLAKLFVILLASVIVSELLGRFANRLLTQVSGISSLFRGFIVIVVKRGVLVIGVLLALTSLGIGLGPILALVGGASFILAFALQSNLGHLVSGLMLLVNKPFDVGDEVEVAGYWAYVDSISLASTKLKGFSGNIINLPNNRVWEGDIINYTNSDIRKLSISISIKFTQDLEQVLSMWTELASSHPKILENPAPGSFPWNSHYDYYISVGLTAWTNTDVYWDVYVDMLKLLQKRLKELNIELAAPQQDITLYQASPDKTATQIPSLGSDE